jgi:hypothetical protein
MSEDYQKNVSELAQFQFSHVTHSRQKILGAPDTDGQYGPGSKVDNPSQISGTPLPWRVLAELAKCEVACQDCNTAVDDGRCMLDQVELGLELGRVALDKEVEAMLTVIELLLKGISNPNTGLALITWKKSVVNLRKGINVMQKKK